MSSDKLAKPKIVVICGPTGSGKTELAVLLCKKFGGEIVNADSRQVYREMNIGTSKGLDKTSNIQYSTSNQHPMNKYSIEGAPIYLVDILEPDERYNVGRFKMDAEEVIEDIVSRGKVPFIVGGTGLYIDSVVDNFQLPVENTQYPIPNTQSISNIQYPLLHSSSFEGQAISENNLKNKNLDDLVKLLGKLDPQAAKIVDLKNRRRVERALEYCLNTGKKFSEMRKKGGRKYEVLKLSPAISQNREKLYEKINTRVDQMIEEGLEEEVKYLADKYGWESEAMTGIGYKEWRPLFENYKLQITNYKQNPNDKFQIAKDLDGVVEEIKKDTRNYAKRQITWFKRDKEINYVKNEKEAEKLVKKFL